MIDFEFPTYTVMEPGDGEIQTEVCAEVTGGDLQREVVVMLTTQDSSALGRSLVCLLVCLLCVCSVC